MKTDLNETQRLQQLAGLNEWKIRKQWNWEADDFGEYNYDTDTFEVEMGSDSFADYMDAEFPGWQENNAISDKGLNQWINDVTNAAKREYGDDVEIDFY